MRPRVDSRLARIAFGIDEHRIDEVGRFAEQVVRQRGRVGQNVALVPERYVFVSGLRVGADDARKAADLLGGHLGLKLSSTEVSYRNAEALRHPKLNSDLGISTGVGSQV
jgi:hypothetical protein